MTSSRKSSKGQLSLLTLLPEDSRASLSVKPGSEAARKMTVTSGQQWSKLYPYSDPLGSLVKTLLESSIWASSRCFLNWKTRAIGLNRSLYQLAPSMPRTEEIESGLLHTPSNQEPGIKTERLATKDGEPARPGQRAYDRKTGRLAQVGLPQQIAMLPTPRGQDSYERRNRKTMEKVAREGGDMTLPTKIATMLPTPATRDYKGANGSAHMEKNRPHMDQLPNAITHGMNLGLKLQPAFALWMMGFPEDWCDLEDGE